MSEHEDSPKITSEVKTKTKYPKRVEAGKKLAALSKALRKKLKTKLEEEDRWDFGKYSVIGILGLMVAAGSLYFAYATYTRATPQFKKEEPTPSPTTINLESLD